MSTGWYILNEHGVPQHEPDMLKANFWLYADDNRLVKKELVEGVEVSTIFLGYDHGWRCPDEEALPHIPILWETMIFGGFCDGHQWRCGGNKEQAEAMHASAVEWLHKQMLLEQPEKGADND